MDEILKSQLLDLLNAFNSKSLPVILGGGYGLFLRQIHMQETDDRTMVEKRAWPAPRSTEDLDIFLSLSIVSDATNMTAVASIIKDLGYQPVEGAEFWQFKKYISETAFVKIDLLSGPIPHSLLSKVQRNAHRIRPKGKSIGLHAHATDEALVLEDGLCAIAVAGTCTDGMHYESKIMVPHPFTYMLMKLHAFRDRIEDDNKDLGEHHALDLFRTIAMMSESEFKTCIELASTHRENPVLASAKEIIKVHFLDASALGILRIKGHSLYFATDQEIEMFIVANKKIFAV